MPKRFNQHQAKDYTEAWQTYRVSSDVDALLLAVFDQVVALKNRVALNLVSSGDDTGAVD
jgi:hypothetical protein